MDNHSALVLPWVRVTAHMHQIRNVTRVDGPSVAIHPIIFRYVHSGKGDREVGEIVWSCLIKLHYYGLGSLSNLTFSWWTTLSNAVPNETAHVWYCSTGIELLHIYSRHYLLRQRLATMLFSECWCELSQGQTTLPDWFHPSTRLQLLHLCARYEMLQEWMASVLWWIKQSTCRWKAWAVFSIFCSLSWCPHWKNVFLNPLTFHLMILNKLQLVSHSATHVR